MEGKGEVETKNSGGVDAKGRWMVVRRKEVKREWKDRKQGR